MLGSEGTLSPAHSDVPPDACECLASTVWGVFYFLPYMYLVYKTKRPSCTRTNRTDVRRPTTRDFRFVRLYLLSVTIRIESIV